MESNQFSITTRRNLLNLAAWTAAWTISMFVARYGAANWWPDSKSLIIAFVILNFALGIGMILANRRFIFGSDELSQKIQLEAMAMTLGLTVIVGLSYNLLDRLDLISQDAEIAHLVMFLGITYLVALLINTFRYK